MHKATHRRKRTATPIWALCKAVLLAFAAATAAMLLLALMLYLEWLPEGAISVGNAIIKVGAAALAGFLVGRSAVQQPWLYGGAAGVLFTGVTTLVFSLLVGSFRPTWSLLGDALLTFAVGAAVSALTARIKPAAVQKA